MAEHSDYMTGQMMEGRMSMRGHTPRNMLMERGDVYLQTIAQYVHGIDLGGSKRILPKFGSKPMTEEQKAALEKRAKRILKKERQEAVRLEKLKPATFAVIFKVYTRGGHIIASSERDYPVGTAEEEIDRDYEAYRDNVLDEIEGSWSYPNKYEGR